MVQIVQFVRVEGGIIVGVKNVGRGGAGGNEIPVVFVIGNGLVRAPLDNEAALLD